MTTQRSRRHQRTALPRSPRGNVTRAARGDAETERLAFVGGVTAGVAHDLKNVLGPLLMLTQVLAARQHGSAPLLDDVLAMMQRPLENGLAIVERLRRFVHAGGGMPAELARLDTVVDEAVALCRLRAQPPRANAVYITIAHRPAPPVRVFMADAVMAVTNLVMNAIDATELDGGGVIVTTTSRHQGATVTVTDDGPGISTEARARLFEPLFTTKSHRGTGLGLMSVRDFARRHGGSIVASPSAAGRGARFTLWLPSSSESPAA